MIKESASINLHIALKCDKDAMWGYLEINDILLRLLSKLEKSELSYYSIALNPIDEDTEDED